MTGMRRFLLVLATLSLAAFAGCAADDAEGEAFGQFVIRTSSSVAGASTLKSDFPATEVVEGSTRILRIPIADPSAGPLLWLEAEDGSRSASVELQWNCLPYFMPAAISRIEVRVDDFSSDEIETARTGCSSVPSEGLQEPGEASRIGVAWSIASEQDLRVASVNGLPLELVGVDGLDVALHRWTFTGSLPSADDASALELLLSSASYTEEASVESAFRGCESALDLRAIGIGARQEGSTLDLSDTCRCLDGTSEYAVADACWRI